MKRTISIILAVVMCLSTFVVGTVSSVSAKSNKTVKITVKEQNTVTVKNNASRKITYNNMGKRSTLFKYKINTKDKVSWKSLSKAKGVINLDNNRKKKRLTVTMTGKVKDGVKYYIGAYVKKKCIFKMSVYHQTFSGISNVKIIRNKKTYGTLSISYTSKYGSVCKVEGYDDFNNLVHYEKNVNFAVKGLKKHLSYNVFITSYYTEDGLRYYSKPVKKHVKGCFDDSDNVVDVGGFLD